MGCGCGVRFRALAERRKYEGRRWLHRRSPLYDGCSSFPNGLRRSHGKGLMARTDAIVLGAGIVGVSVALHLAKRGLAVALVDRGEPGQGTSYGNAGIIEGNTLFPARFP